MNSISSISKLTFFKAEKCEHYHHYTFDASASPRPYFCIGLITEGEASFYDSANTETIHIVPGDVIFVPITSRYVSVWKGSPHVSYISMHFLFDYPGVFSRQRNFKLQKIELDNPEEIKRDFEYILKNYDKDETSMLSVMGKFYNFLSSVMPHLKEHDTKAIDSRLSAAIEYIEKNYNREISVDTLAEICNMSSSRLFPCFKQSFGVSPVEYLNKYRINRAIILLMSDPYKSIESISETVGFESSTYFRRVFKKQTQKTPREYRKTAIEV